MNASSVAGRKGCKGIFAKSISSEKNVHERKSHVMQIKNLKILISIDVV
jgi:hypothetical protein